MLVVKKLESVEEKLKAIKEDSYSLSVGLRLRENMLERVSGALKGKTSLIESLREGVKGIKKGQRGAREGAGRGDETPTVEDLWPRTLL